MDAWDRVSCAELSRPMHRVNDFTAKYGTDNEPHAHILNIAVLERDRRLTGFMRGQTDRPHAPPGFELNNPWRVRDDTPAFWHSTDVYQVEGRFF